HRSGSDRGARRNDHHPQRGVGRRGRHDRPAPGRRRGREETGVAMPPHILIVDDDKATCRFIEELLAGQGRQFTSAHDPDDAVKRIHETPFDLLITDLNLNAARSGLDVLRTFAAAWPSSPVILISGFGTLETAIDAVRAGAFDFISKPFEIGAVKATVERALRQAPLRRSDKEPQESFAAESGLLGRTAGMLGVYQRIARAGASDVAVLDTGDGGRGQGAGAR